MLCSSATGWSSVLSVLYFPQSGYFYAPCYSDIHVDGIFAQCNFMWTENILRGPQMLQEFPAKSSRHYVRWPPWYRGWYCSRFPSTSWYSHGDFKASLDLASMLVVLWLTLLSEAFPLVFTSSPLFIPGLPKPHLTRPRQEARHVSKMQIWSCHFSFKNHSHPVSWWRCKFVRVFWKSPGI